MKILLIILVVLVILFIILYNRLVRLNIRVKNSWSSIDNQLKRRADLIPNLVEVTKGFAKHESETLINLVNARNNNINETAINSEKISQNLTKLLALTENYPELKSDKLFSNLMIELTGTEDKIAYARQFYNDCVQHFNTAIMTFPNNIIAKIFKYKEKEYFQINESDRNLVKVEFDK